MSAELACSYAALILHDEEIEITAEKIKAIVDAAKVKDVEPIWATLFAKALKGVDLKTYFTSFGSPSAAPAAAAAAAPAAAAKEEKKEAKKEEKKESEEDGDMGFGLFD